MNSTIPYQRILITGGAGFIGSRLAIHLKTSFPQTQVVVMDNMIRAGSELHLSHLQEHGVEFIKGDIRNSDDLKKIDGDLLIACAAEPSVLAGVGSSPRYVIETNLNGTLESLEWARERGAGFFFFSSSRVYPLDRVRAIPYVERESRLEWTTPGDELSSFLSKDGITLDFPTEGIRSMYGTTKLASEELIREYASAYDIPSIITRFGVVSGPGQMGQVQQGFVSFWVAKHFFSGSLSYNGFGGTGKQVRDFLHVRDLCTLVSRQLAVLPQCRGELYQAAGGKDFSVSLRELTQLCQEVMGMKVKIKENPESHQNDLPILLLDSARVRDEFSWKPQVSARQLVEEIHTWLIENEKDLKALFCK
jgi:CDP-paratose 2-epimerase